MQFITKIKGSSSGDPLLRRRFWETETLFVCLLTEVAGGEVIELEADIGDEAIEADKAGVISSETKLLFITRSGVRKVCSS